MNAIGLMALLASALMFCTIQESTLPDGTTNLPETEIATPEENYAEYCASCHGADARAFADRNTWVHGSDKASIHRVIVEGLVNDGMPAFEVTFTEEEVEALSQYIVDAKLYVDQYAFVESFDDSQVFTYGTHQYRLEMVTDQVDIPWGMARAHNGDHYYTDRSGALRMLDDQGTVVDISGLPEIKAIGQGGLMDVLLAKDYETTKRIYFTYSKPNPANADEVTTAVHTGIVTDGEITQGEDIWIAKPYYPTRYHFGSRMIWDNDGYLYVSIGDRGKRDVNPQDLSLHPGKIHRIHADGSIPEDNPFVGQSGVVSSIYSYGHRNPQGLAYDAQRNIIYENEHGPRGGDEINIIRPEVNYGWPVISYGINYSGTTFTELTEAPGMEQPIHYWVPAIGVCGLAYVSSDLYPDWQGHLLSGSLKYEYLNLNRVGSDANDEERLFPKVGRLRSVIQGADDYIYIGVEDPGRIYRIVPVY
ncbi:MAG: PQQ-dependent sugar dehydrogenase [Bacteroidota bacterium]